MNIVIDENIPKIVIKFLEQYHFKIIDIRGTSMEGSDDQSIFNYSKDRNAVFLTTDKDFFHTIHFNNKPHYGIIVIALSQPNSVNIYEKVEWFLSNMNLEKLNDHCYLISNNQCKIYN